MRIEIGQIITQIISFLVMLWVLKRFAWKPLLSIMEQRRNRIQSDFDTIAEKNKQADALIQEYNDKLKEIDIVAQDKIKEAIEEGKKRAQAIQDEGHAKARALFNKTQEDLQKEIHRSKIQLKNELVNMTIAATENILKTNLDKEKQKNLISEFVEQMVSS